MKTVPDPQRRAGVGSHVEVELLDRAGKGERLSFDIVPDRSADFGQGFLGASTLLARTLQGHSAGRVLPYEVDDILRVRILSVAASQKAPPKDIAARRQETIRKAVEESDRTNAMIFASSFSGKWGDYDPQGFVSEADEEEEKKTGRHGDGETG